MLHKAVRLSYILLQNYFAWMFLSAIVLLYTKHGWLESSILPLLIYLVAIFSPKKKGDFDILIYLILGLSLITWIFNDYNNKGLMIFRCLLGQTAFIFAYFIGKIYNVRFHVNILEKGLLPFSVCCIIGIYCYFIPPGWYVEATAEDAGSYSGNSFLEYFRLRSVFGSSYYISYFCMLESLYIVYKLVILKIKKTRLLWCYLFLFLFSLMLTMMRAPIVCFLIGTFLIIIYSSFHSKNLMPLFKLVLTSAFLAVLLGMGIGRLDSEQREFLQNKAMSVGDKSSELRKRTDFSIQYDLIGDGVGRHASYAEELSDNEVVADSEYKKIMTEYGYVGLFLISILLIFAIVKCFVNLEYLVFEFCCILALVITMIGADPLSTGNKHCLIFWMIIGYISSFKKRKGFECSICSNN